MYTPRAFLFLLLLLLCLCGCTYNATFKRPYSQVESALLQRLDTGGKEVGAGAQAWIASRDLAGCLHENGFIGISDYTAGQHIQLRRYETYNIGGVGHNELTIDLQKVDAQQTRIFVDYLDRAAGFFLIPFTYANPGGIRERKIAKCLSRLEGVPQDADRIQRPAVRPRPDQSCERLQGLSCGPPGTVLPCATASGPSLQCVCEGTWRCR